MLHCFWKYHRKANRCFELIPGTLEPAVEFFSSPSAIAGLENEQLKTVEMNKSVKNVVLGISTYLSSVSYILIPILRVCLTAHFCQLASVSNFYACLIIHNSSFSFSWTERILSNLCHTCFLWYFVDWYLFMKNFKEYTFKNLSKWVLLKRVKNLSKQFHITRIVFSTHITCRPPFIGNHLICIISRSCTYQQTIIAVILWTCLEISFFNSK